MIVEKIIVRNYRLLKDFSIDLEKDLSLIVGKNNTGKTSLLTVIHKFLNGPDKTRFSFDDFNIDLKNHINGLVAADKIVSIGFVPIGIEMKLLIKYNDNDNLANLSRVMMDLDPEHYFILLGFSYTMDYDSLLKLREDFTTFNKKEQAKNDDNQSSAGSAVSRSQSRKTDSNKGANSRAPQAETDDKPSSAASAVRRTQSRARAGLPSPSHHSVVDLSVVALTAASMDVDMASPDGAAQNQRSGSPSFSPQLGQETPPNIGGSGANNAALNATSFRR